MIGETSRLAFLDTRRVFHFLPRSTTFSLRKELLSRIGCFVNDVMYTRAKFLEKNDVKFVSQCLSFRILLFCIST